MIALNLLAVQNIAVLRALDAVPPPESSADLARQLGRDKSNLSKSLKALEDAGLVDAPFSDGSRQLSEDGRAQLEAIDRAEREPAAAAALHQNLRGNPLNPRKAFDADQLDELAESIAEAGLLQPLLVTPPDAAGVRMILAGERRWRAIGLLIERGLWPADQALPIVERAPDASEAAQAQFLGLIENGRRTGLSYLEEARAYAALVASTGWSRAEAARRTGANARVVQEMLKVLEEASAEDLARLERGEITARELRYSVREPGPDAGKPEPRDDFARQLAEVTVAEHQQDLESRIGEEAELTPIEILVLIEIQAAAKVRPVESALGPCAQIDEDPKLAEWPPEMELASRGYISIRGGYQGNVTLLRPAQAYLGRLIFTLAEPAARLRKARQDAGLTDEAIAELEAEERFDRSWLNERNRPKKITPAEALVAMELHQAGVEQKADYYGVAIAPDYDKAELAGLAERQIIDQPRVREHQTKTTVSWYVKRSLERQYPGWEKAKPRAAHLKALRIEVLGPEAAAAIADGKFATSWLNGPFEIPPEALAEKEKAKAEDAARKARAEAQQAAEAELKANRDQAITALEADVATLSPEDRIQRFADILALLDGPAPWKPGRGYYELAVAANGRRLDADSSAARRLAVLAVNIAAGVDFSTVDQPPAPVTREVFEGWISKRLQEHMTAEGDPALLARHAKAALDRYLAEGLDGTEDVAFGDGDYEWSEPVANEAADFWADDFDLEIEPPAQEAVADADVDQLEDA